MWGGARACRSGSEGWAIEAVEGAAHEMHTLPSGYTLGCQKSEVILRVGGMLG